MRSDEALQIISPGFANRIAVEEAPLAGVVEPQARYGPAPSRDLRFSSPTSASATGRAHGLRLCRELSPSIIVMELWLQGEDAFDLIEQLAALPGKPRVLAPTRRCDPVAMHRAREGRLAGWSANGVTH